MNFPAVNHHGLSVVHYKHCHTTYNFYVKNEPNNRTVDFPLTLSGYLKVGAYIRISHCCTSITWILPYSGLSAFLKQCNNVTYIFCLLNLTIKL